MEIKIISFYFVISYLRFMTGAELKKLREEAKLTQKELAEKLEVQQSRISHWECDDHKISKAYIKVLNSFFSKK